MGQLHSYKRTDSMYRIKVYMSIAIYCKPDRNTALKSAVHSVNSNLYKQIHTVGMLTCHASVDTLATPSQGNLVS